MLEKKYYDGMQIHDVLCECLDDYDTILTILEKFASLPSAINADRKTEPFAKDINVRSKTEPQTDDKCKGCIYENGDSLMACVSCQGKVPYDGYEWDEPQPDCSWK